MSYFKSFPLTSYKFGNEVQDTAFRNLNLYVDVIDQIKDNISFYNFYTIRDGDRPDNVSQSLYGSPRFYWTFYLMNDHIREQGWPLTNYQLQQKALEIYPYFTLTTTDAIPSSFDIGQTVTGLTSNAVGTVVDKRMDFGQIVVELTTSTEFLSTEIITSPGDNGLETATLSAAVVQYNAIHHYEDADGNWVDVDPFVGVAGLNVAVTNLEYITAQNETLKQIKVIKPGSINNVNRAFNSSLRL